MEITETNLVLKTKAGINKPKKTTIPELSRITKKNGQCYSIDDEIKFAVSLYSGVVSDLQEINDYGNLKCMGLPIYNSILMQTMKDDIFPLKGGINNPTYTQVDSKYRYPLPFYYAVSVHNNTAKVIFTGLYSDDLSYQFQSLNQLMKGNQVYQVALNKKEVETLNETCYYLRNTYQYFAANQCQKIEMYVVSNRAAIFETMCYLYGGVIHYNDLTEEMTQMLDNLTGDQPYSIEYFEQLGVTPCPIVIKNEIVEVPILEQIGEQWVFYAHNYKKEREAK